MSASHLHNIIPVPSREAVDTNFNVLGLKRPGIESQPTVLAVDDLSLHH